MAAVSSFTFLFYFFVIAFFAPEESYASPAFGFDMHHRFSDRVRQWMKSMPRDLPGGWPEKGTAEYYAALVGHDRGRSLAEVAPKLAFSDGNETVRINLLGFLHYAEVSLGTPNVTFLVALDTGSNLFWVPCDCTSCAPTSSDSNGLGVELHNYSPSVSTTSQNVPCNSTLCAYRNHNGCPRGEDVCPYIVEYVSAQTSSSGYLVNDVLYLTTEDSKPEVVKAPIVFGCGQIQTGSFLGDAAPNGLFGLGMDNLSVPSVLSSRGLTSNSFSMCFGRDGFGRINFGDQGTSDQQETSFNVNEKNSIYNISITGIEVGNSSSDVSFSALVDSGTSFTTLADPAYTKLSESFNTELKRTRANADSSIPFEYCYYLSSNESVIHLPAINFITQGGSKFPVNYPVIFISNQQRDFMYCLALVKSSKLNIIGQNFLTGLRVVFDRERMILGWKKFNCYNIEDSNPLPVNPKNSSALPPPPTLGPNGYSPEATKQTGNGTQALILRRYSGLEEKYTMKKGSSIEDHRHTCRQVELSVLKLARSKWIESRSKQKRTE
ncbi:aspartyl protease family protein 1-like isoform X2 [Phalaenopsis equestris]|uniref:aspartyl protease family protein 1-like isoform X2 n=1 Tax=Phalaenopsis equestris TaxID=78828 RepID=UPI0009E575C9|nr:aspartyl protease family protein 1-like isoform X2 [Phalaenopsis equestris]